MVAVADELACLMIDAIVEKISAHKTVGKRLYGLLAFLYLVNEQTLVGMAIILTDDNVLRDIDKSSCKITRVGCTKSGIGKSLSGSAGGDEVFENIQTLSIVSSDRNFDYFTGSVGYKSAHTGKLSYLAH